MSIQQVILKGIREQLSEHDYLVIPGFGGFVLKPYPAQIAAGGNQLFPPSKTVSFNSQLKQNDGILVQWLQKEMDCSSATAIGHLNDFTEYCQSILRTKRRLGLDSIGFFFMDFENNLCFEPQHDHNYLSSSFGLAPVGLHPLPVQQEKVLQEIGHFADRKVAQQVPGVRDQPQRRYRIRQVIMVLSVFAFLSLFLVFLTGRSFSNGYLNASLFDQENINRYKPLTYPKLEISGSGMEIKPYVADANGIAHVKVADKVLAVNVLNTIATERIASGQGKYELVFGCFAVKNNAERLIRKLNRKKIRAAITGTNSRGMYVVSTGNFPEKEEALLQLERVKDHYPNTWIRQKD